MSSSAPTPTFGNLSDENMRTLVRTGIHPFIMKTLGTSPAALAHPPTTYDRAMADHLPAPSDIRGILDFFGLSSDAVARVLTARPDASSLPAMAKNAATNRWDFPLAEALESTYHDTAPPPLQRPVPETYEGYVGCALQQGLRPEFACTIGLHRDDPRWESIGEEEYYQVVSAVEASRERVASNRLMLGALWKSRMEAEGEQSVGVGAPR